jgi:hypothetical protein
MGSRVELRPAADRIDAQYDDARSRLGLGVGPQPGQSESGSSSLHSFGASVWSSSGPQ